MNVAYEKWKEHQKDKAFAIATALECVEEVQKEIEKVQMEMEKQAETEDKYTRNSRTYHLNDLKKRLRQAEAAVPDIRCTFCESGERVDEFTGKPGPARCYLLKKRQVKNGESSAYCNSHASLENQVPGTCAGSGETNRWPKHHRESQKSEGKVSGLKDKKGKAPVGAANAPIVLDDEEDESQRGNSASDGASPTRAGKRPRGADDQRDDTPSRPRKRAECKHGMQERNCRDCNSCRCGKARKGTCDKCGLSPSAERCDHGVQKRQCSKCNPCPHGKLKRHCSKCTPCPHGRLKRYCTECKAEVKEEA
jgi:hypothetical protein